MKRLDHSILSPSGHVSNRYRNRIIKEARENLRALLAEVEADREAKRDRVAEQREADLRRAARLRDLASRGMKPRAFAKEAARLEDKWKP